jgi:predicted RNA-binding Zn ribbon-like protein
MSAYEFVGGPACLDFANTVGSRRPRPGREQRDLVSDSDALAAWARARGLPGAAGTHREAVELREAIYETFSAIAEARPAPPEALRVIQDVYVDALGAAKLAPGGWEWPADQVLWALARSAVELLTSDRLARVKACPGDDGECGWLFLDTSKNATRRWCSMRTCGSRVKSRRQVERLRAARGR